MMDNNVLNAILLSFLAGMSTVIGGLIAFIVKKKDYWFLSLCLGFSAGVMLYVSFMEILPDAEKLLFASHNKLYASIIFLSSFLFGILITALIDKFIPDHLDADIIKNEVNQLTRFKKVGLLVTLAVAIHNFPEGLATFMSALNNPTWGISIAIAIALHNIPEGISISLPVYYATNSKRKALFYSFVSGITEPLGAIIGFIFLRSFLNNTFFGIIMAFVAGIMIYIALDELIPLSKEYSNDHYSILGVVIGMFIMAITLIIL